MIRKSLLATSLAATLAACAAAPDEPIHIGLAGPIELPNGRSFRLAAEMAVDEINAAGGVNGRPLALVIKDDSANASRAIEVAAELRDDPRVVAVVGHVNSDATLAAAEIYNDAARGVLQITPASSSPKVTDAGEWTFRLCPTDLQHGPALAGWARERLGGSRAAVIYANDAYGRGVLESFATAFAEAGGEIIARDPYLPELIADERTLDPYLERALRNDVDVLMLAGQAGAGVRVLSAARRLGYTGPVLGADGMTNLKDQGAIAEGVYISSSFLPDRPSREAQAFVTAYRERYDELPDHRGAMAYDAVKLIARAIGEVGADRLALRDYIAAVGTTRRAYDGVAGRVIFDPHGDAADKEVAIGVVERGVLRTAR